MFGSTSGVRSLAGQGVRSSNKRFKKLRDCLPAVCLCERLEQRQLLSVNAMTLAGDVVGVGNTFTYSYTETAADGSTVVSGPLQYTVAGTTTFNHNTVTEIDINAVGASTPPDTQYRGFDSNGNFDSFGEVTPQSNGSDVETDTENPYQINLPASLTFGTPFTTSSTQSRVLTNGSGNITQQTTVDQSDVISLVSATPVTVTVPAGTFTNAYEVQDIETDTGGQDSVQVNDTWYVPGVGAVKITGDDQTDGNSEVSELTSDTIARDSLAFTAQPTNAGEGATITPAVAVSMENSSGDVDPDGTGSVTLSLGTSTGAGTLSGTLTEPVVNGVATFNDLSINQAGNYTLSAVNPDASGTATSNAFQITGGGDHLEITKQPTGAAVNAAIPLTVAVENDSDVVDTSATGAIDLTLNTVQGGEGAKLGGTISATLKDGVATFSGGEAPKINVNGSYTLTADQTVNGSSVDSVDSDEFSVGTDTLKFDPQPLEKIDPDAPIQFFVNAENSDKKVDTNYDGEVQISLHVIKGDSGTVLGGADTGDFVDGVATFKGDDAPTIGQPGTYTLTMTPVTEDGEPDTNVKPVTSREFQISKLHLDFIAQPQDTNIGAGIGFKVALKDANNETVADDSSDRVKVSDVYRISGGPTLTFFAASEPLVNGIATFPSTGAYALKLNEAGTFQIEVVEDDSKDNDITTTPLTKSDKFKTLGFHLVFLTQPPDTTPAGQPVTFSVEVDNDLGDLVTTEDGNYIDVIKVIGRAGSGATLPIGATGKPASIEDGIATFDAALVNIIPTPGIYRYTVAEVSALGSTSSGDDTIVTYTRQAISNWFKIT